MSELLVNVGELVDAIVPILSESDDLRESIPLGREPHAHIQREARELVGALLDVSSASVSAARNAAVDADVVVRAFSAAKRRRTGEPLAYCVGSAAFRNLVLSVDARVLIPRPETEIVVEEALRVTRDSPGGIAIDIGTGSGAIALALATEGRFDRVIATDISSDALDVARHNATQLQVPHASVEFRIGSDLAPIDGVRARVIVSNPPYIAFEEASALPASVRNWEPSTALFAPDKGMARYDVLLAGAPKHLEAGGWLVLEVDSTRAGQTASLATATGHYASVRLVRDLSGRERVLVARVA